METLPEKWRDRIPPTEKHLDMLKRSKSGLVNTHASSTSTRWVTKEIEVTIVEVRLVPCAWTNNEWYVGWRAEDKDGNEYFNNWKLFPSDSMRPSYHWDGTSAGYDDLVDAKQAFEYNSMFPYCTPEGQRAVPTGYKVCEKHPDQLVSLNPASKGYVNKAGEPICPLCALRELERA